MERDRLLIQTDDRTDRVIRLSVVVQDVFHGRNERTSHAGQAPLLMPPWLELILLEHLADCFLRDVFDVPELDELVTEQTERPMVMAVWGRGAGDGDEVSRLDPDADTRLDKG